MLFAQSLWGGVYEDPGRAVARVRAIFEGCATRELRAHAEGPQHAVTVFFADVIDIGLAGLDWP